jgi:hypothetical protein
MTVVPRTAASARSRRSTIPTRACYVIARRPICRRRSGRARRHDEKKAATGPNAVPDRASRHGSRTGQASWLDEIGIYQCQAREARPSASTRKAHSVHSAAAALDGRSAASRSLAASSSYARRTICGGKKSPTPLRLGYGIARTCTGAGRRHLAPLIETVDNHDTTRSEPRSCGDRAPPAKYGFRARPACYLSVTPQSEAR